MRKTLLMAAAVFGFVNSSHAQEANPSPYVSRELQPNSFNSVEVAGPFQTFIRVGAGPAQVRLIGPAALLADTIVAVEDKTLSLRFRDGARWSWNPGSGVNVVISAPSLASARIKGAAQVEIDQVRGEEFSAATDGSGTIALRDLDVGRAQFATGGSGGITAEGRAREGVYATGGSGSIDAKRLRVEIAAITVRGAGSIYADVSRSAKVAVAGSGKVDVVGGGTCIKRSVRLSQIECR